MYESELDFRNVDELALQVYNMLTDPQVEVELREWCAETLEEYEYEVWLIRRGDRGFREFLTTYLSREAERAHLAREGADPDATPLDDLRTEACCTCADLGCELKHGRLPQRVRAAADPHQGILEYSLEHTGDPLVLDHTESPKGARQAWAATHGEVRTMLYEVYSYLDPNMGTRIWGGHPRLCGSRIV